jgi:hypothetical protein
VSLKPSDLHVVLKGGRNMKTLRLIFGLALISLCVFGVPEGCLVFASHVPSSIQSMPNVEMSMPIGH